MIPLQMAERHPVSRIAFSPDGMVAVAQPHYGVTILDRAMGGTLAVCAMPRRAELTGLTFCGGGKYLAASHAKGIEVFSASSGARVAVSFKPAFKSLMLAERGGSAFGFGLFTAGSVWRPDVADNQGFDNAHSDRHDAIALSPDARFALRPSTRSRVELYYLSECRDVGELERPDDEDSGKPPVARFCPRGHRVAFNDGRTIDVYDIPEPTECDSPPEDAGEPDSTRTPVAPMPHMLLSSNFSLKPDNPAEEGEWYPPFALLPDGRGLLVKRPRNRIQLWDAPTATVVNEWSWQFEWVTCVAVSADGQTAVAGGRFGRVLLWDLE